jgi:hypothetical protein
MTTQRVHRHLSVRIRFGHSQRLSASISICRLKNDTSVDEMLLRLSSNLAFRIPAIRPDAPTRFTIATDRPHPVFPLRRHNEEISSRPMAFFKRGQERRNETQFTALVNDRCRWASHSIADDCIDSLSTFVKTISATRRVVSLVSFGTQPAGGSFRLICLDGDCFKMPRP